MDAEFARREQLRELMVFLSLIVPSIAISFLAVRQGSLSFALTALATILRDLGLISLIAFFLWRNGESSKRIGWSTRKGWRNAFLGVALFVPVFMGAGLLEQFLRAAGFSAPATPTPRWLTAKGPLEFLLAGVLVVVVAIAEEIIFRGYLILRFTALTRNRSTAVVLSSILFALGHGYEGTAGVLTIGFMGLIFALVYLSRRSLVAPIVMHFLQDFGTIVLLPLLRHR